MAPVTVRSPDPITVPRVALITVLPLLRLVAAPLLPGVSLTVATFGAEELQCTEMVRSWVEPSENVPAAVNVWFTPEGIAAVAGFTVTATTEADVILSSADPLILPRLAVMVEVPLAREVPIPFELTLATTVLPELQVAEDVRSCVLPSVKLPKAVNCCIVPSATDGLAGLTVIEASATVLTVRLVEAEMDPEVAEMLELPVAMVVAKP